MPRKYQPLKAKKEIDPEALKSAIEDINNGKSLRVSAKLHGIHYSVLYRHYKRGDTIKKKGGQTALSEEEEKILVSRLGVCADWGYPIDSWTLRLLIKESLDRQGKTVRQFKDNLPGRDFVESFLRRHKDDLSSRMCQNIKRARAAISPQVINAYFDKLEKELVNIPPCNIINYDETNLSDDPGRKKVITRRGCKYPERVMNSTKSSTSVMFSAAADGEILPPYVVYKALHLYESWREGGPDGSRYNRTKSGWFDNYCFSDYVETVALPYFRRLDGKKYMIGDNLASHLSLETIKKCADSDVHFIFLPSNSTHLTQPLDVAFFRPLKMAWRKLLLEWKLGPGRNEPTIPKSKFPSLLKALCESCKSENVKSGFRKCGIYPLKRSEVLNMLPPEDMSTQSEESTATTPAQSPVVAIDDTFKELLKTLRNPEVTKPRKKRVKVNVEPGKSVSVADFESDPDDVPVSVDDLPVASKPGVRGTSGAPSSKKKNTKTVCESSSDDSDYSVQDSDQDLVPSDTSSDLDEIDIQELNPSLQIEDFAIVKVYGDSTKVYRMYICQVTELQDDGYVGRFYKKNLNSSTFSATEEESFFEKADVVMKLRPPVDVSKSSSRFKNRLSFVDDISHFTLY